MMTDRGRPSSVAGGLVRHIPVLLSEVLTALKPKSGERIIDGTFGAGGYSNAILSAADCRVLAIDRDPQALANAEELTSEFPQRFDAVLGRYSEMESLAAARGIDAVDGVVLDIGVSSMQLDQPDRGFSFVKDGPLDMRMGTEGLCAADIVNDFEEAQIAEILFVFGEERRSRAIAKAVVKSRSAAAITRTSQLAEIVAGVLGRSRDEAKHPATRTFQALRLYVNAELEELAGGLSAAERLLAPGGRLVVVTFHSLEDRIVKRFFTRCATPPKKGSRHLPEQEHEEFLPSFQLLNRRPVEASEEEVRSNPRARSARLRAGVRTAAPAVDSDLVGLGVPELRQTRSA